MKYLSLFIVFAVGVALGRFSVTAFETPVAETDQGTVESSKSTESKTKDLISLKSETTMGATPESNTDRPTLALVRTDAKAQDKHIRSLFDQLQKARQEGNLEEQNRFFAEIEALNPKHEVFFRAKAQFLEEDEDWEAAQTVYKDCITVLPQSIPCLQRLANIRTSTIDEKIKYAFACLESSNDDSLCLVDLAIALSSRGDFDRAKVYFEKALALPQKTTGYDRSYILYQYGFTLEGLSRPQDSQKAFAAACKLKMKAACDQLNGATSQN